MGSARFVAGGLLRAWRIPDFRISGQYYSRAEPPRFFARPARHSRATISDSAGRSSLRWHAHRRLGAQRAHGGAAKGSRHGVAVDRHPYGIGEGILRGDEAAVLGRHGDRQSDLILIRISPRISRIYADQNNS